MRATPHVVIESVGMQIGVHGRPFVIEEPFFLSQGLVGPADIETAGRWFDGWQDHLDTVWVDHSGGTGLDDFLDGFHTRP